MVFLLAAALSLSVSEVPVGGLLNYLQWIFIFIVVVPFGVIVSQKKHVRWCIFVGILLVINFLTILSVWKYITVAHQLRQITLWYGNQNQLYWLVSVGCVFNLMLFLESRSANITRSFAIIFTVIQLFLIIGGLTLSAWLMLAFSIYVGIIYFLHKNSLTRFIRLYLFATVVFALAGLILVIINWEFIHTQGSLDARIPQYALALKIGLERFPLGIGLESSEIILNARITQFAPEAQSLVIGSVHNFFFAFFLEVGIFGAVAFTIVYIDWMRGALQAIYYHSKKFDFADVAFVISFSGYILITLVQPVPVRRFWWILFACSWGLMVKIFS
jgi:hypothetical protein